MQNEKCWASCLDNCSSKISAEHIFSKSLTAFDKFSIKGLPWCLDDYKTVGIGSLTAKVLCEKHNNALSPVDDAGCKAYAALREWARIHSVRSQLSPRFWNVVRHRINGPLLERWFLKTLINIWCDQGRFIGHDAVVEGRPSERIVYNVFGRQPFRHRSGLYSAFGVGQDITSDENLYVCSIVFKEQFVSGALFIFRGFHFLIWPNEDGPPHPSMFQHMQMDRMDWTKAEFFLHPRSLRSKHSGFLSQIVHIVW